MQLEVEPYQADSYTEEESSGRRGQDKYGDITSKLQYIQEQLMSSRATREGRTSPAASLLSTVPQPTNMLPSERSHEESSQSEQHLIAHEPFEAIGPLGGPHKGDPCPVKEDSTYSSVEFTRPVVERSRLGETNSKKEE
jgi:hypothetical protein